MTEYKGVKRVPPVTAGIIGLGRIASGLEADLLREKPCTHAGAMMAAKNVNLVAGADLASAARMRFTQQWKGHKELRVYPSAAALLRAQRLQLLHIATPPHTHLAILKQAVRAAVPVVVLEKPIAPTRLAVERFLQTYLRADGSLPPTFPRILINHERRFANDYRAVRELMRTQAYGTLLSVTAQFYSRTPARVLDLMLHDGTHLVDAVFYFLEADAAKAEAARLRSFAGTGKWLLPIRDWKTLVTSERPRAGKHFSAQLTRGIKAAAAKTQRAETLNITFSYNTQPAHKKQLWVPVHLEFGSGREYFHFKVTLNCSQGRLHIGNGILQAERAAPSPYYEGFQSLKAAPRPLRTRRTQAFANMLQSAVTLVRDEHAPNPAPLTSGCLPLLLKHTVERVLQ